MKRIYLLFVAVILAACSADPLENEVLSGLDANLEGKNGKNAKAQDAGEEFIIPDSICAGEDAYFEINAPVGSNIQVQQYDTDLGEWVQVDQISKSLTNPHITTLNFETAGEYQLRYKAGSGGYTETSVIVENCGCLESFDYIDNEDGTYTFTYVPEEDIAGAELVFTFAQSVEVSGLDGWENSGNATSSTEKITIDLNACQAYVWTVTLQKDCSGKSKNSNVWTDFKVNETSKKGELDNITENCPE